MIKSIISADLHLRMWRDKERTNDNIPRKLHDTFSVFTDMCEYAITNGIKYVIIAGDINDLKGVVHAKAFTLFSEILDKYKELQFILLHGNHDACFSGTVDSSIELLKRPNVKVILEPTVLDEFPNAVFIPHSSNLKEHINKYKSNYDVLISHFALSEAQVSHNLTINTNMSISMLSGYKYVILGDYHKPQELEYDDLTVIYTGSPIPLTFNEKNQDKRFIVFDFDTYEIESIPTKGYRKILEFVIDKEDNKDSIIEQARKEIENGNIVRVVNKVKDLKLDIDDVSIIDQSELDYENRGISLDCALEDQFKTYCEIKEIPKNEIEKYVDYGMYFTKYD